MLRNDSTDFCGMEDDEHTVPTAPKGISIVKRYLKAVAWEAAAVAWEAATTWAAEVPMLFLLP